MAGRAPSVKLIGPTGAVLRSRRHSASSSSTGPAPARVVTCRPSSARRVQGTFVPHEGSLGPLTGRGVAPMVDPGRHGTVPLTGGDAMTSSIEESGAPAPGAPEGGGGRPRVVVGVDGSSGSRAALVHALSAAVGRGADVVVVAS